MVDWEAIGAIGETIGAAGVVVTLVYLARQVRHSRREQQFAAIRANRDERREYFESVRDSPFIPLIESKLEAGETLTVEEQRRLRYHNAASWGLVYSEWIQAQMGLSGEYSTSIDANITLVLRLPGARQFIDEFGRALYPSRFIADVDRIGRELGSSPVGVAASDPA